MYTQGSGDIDQYELREVMKHCIEESQMTLETGALDSLTQALFEMADTDQSGSISFNELYAVLEQYPEVMDNLTFRYRCLIRWTRPVWCNFALF